MNTGFAATSLVEPLMSDHPFRNLPQVSKVLAAPGLAAAQAVHAPEAVTAAVRAELAAIRAGEVAVADVDAIASRAVARLVDAARPRFRPVINATGIVLHTNLGRSPLAEEAARAAYDAARGYLNLELDLGTGKRSSRQDPVRAGIRALTGAEAGTVVNNCAAATVIVLRALAAGKEVIVSRGQLVEIGGSFRIPDILAVSGATLREVGTTNITRVADYAAAIGPNTGLLLRVHTSNFRVRGFTQAVGIDDLVALGRAHGIPVVDDVGSGRAVDLDPFGLPGEPHVADGIRAGADLVLFSGDKLLGGPQAGIIAGHAKWIAKIEADPMMRAFRLDKMTLAALEATLRIYANPERAMSELPTLRMLAMPLSELRTRSEALAERLRAVPGVSVELRDDIAYVGGGSLPDQAVPTVVLAINIAGVGETEVAAKLRTGSPAVMGRVQDGRVLLDLRTVFPRQEDGLFAAIAAVSG